MPGAPGSRLELSLPGSAGWLRGWLRGWGCAGRGARSVADARVGDLRPRSMGTPVASLRGPLGDFLSEVPLASLLKQPGRRSDAAAGLQALQSGFALVAQRDPGRGKGGSPDGEAARQSPTGAPPRPRGAGQPPRPHRSPAACPASGGFSAPICKMPRWDPARRSGVADWTGGRR